MYQLKTLLPVLLATICSIAPGCHSKAGQPDNINTQDTAARIQRFGMVIKIKPEKIALYKELHANTWPGVLKQISKSNIRNYSIYLKDDYLFSYFEYTGTDFKKDMALMAADSTTRAWWKLTDPCQEPLPTRDSGEWWAKMEEVFHHD